MVSTVFMFLTVNHKKTMLQTGLEPVTGSS